jgi:hypothetical protein
MKGAGEFWEELCSSDEERKIAAAAVEIMKSEWRVEGTLCSAPFPSYQYLVKLA